MCFSMCQNGVPRNRVRNQKQRFWRWRVVFLMGVHQSSYVTSTIRVKVSFLDDNLEQQAKYEWFSALITVRTRMSRTNQVVYCSATQYSSWGWVDLQLQLHINPGLLDSVAASPLLRPSKMTHSDYVRKCCLLWIVKTSSKEKNYIWISVRWKAKN